MKKWLKSNWKTILLIVIAIAIFITNICILIYVDYKKSEWLTFFSGWVSGFATIVLGVIAIIQNRTYKRENEAFLERQKEENVALIKKQLDYTEFNNLMNQRCDFNKNIKERLHDFIAKFDFRRVTLWLAELQVEANSTQSINDLSQGALINHFFDELEIEYNDLKQFLNGDWYKSEENEKIIAALDSYFNELISIKSQLNYLEIPKFIKMFNNQCGPLFADLILAKNNYVTMIDVDFNMVLTTKSGNVDFVKEHYCYLKNDVN